MSIVTSHNRSILLILLFSTITARLSYSQSNYWQPTNGPFTGRVTSLAISDSGSIFVGTENAGIFRSVDNGSTWVQVNSDLSDNQVLSLAINNQEEIFASTFHGIYQSTDNGDTWAKLQGGIGNTVIYCLAIDKSQFLYGGDPDGDVWRSTDNGLSWRFFNDYLPWTHVNTLTIDSSGNIYAGTGDIFPGSGIYLSTNQGVNWNRVTATNNNVVSIATSPNGTIFATESAAWVEDHGSILRSTNNGLTWEQVCAGYRHVDVTSVAVDKNNSVFVGTYSTGIIKSTDNGNNWFQADSQFTNLLINKIVIDSKDNVYTGAYRGVHRSTDNGTNWDHIGIPQTEITSLAANSQGYLFAGTPEDGLFASTNSGSTWNYCSLLGNGGIICLAMSPEQTIFAGTSSNAVFRSTNNGLTWIQSGNSWVHATVFAFDKNGCIYHGSGNGVFRSTDSGSTWTQFTSGLKNPHILSLIVHPSGPVLAGTDGDGVYRSTDYGISWQPSNLEIEHTHVLSLVVDPEGTIWGGTDNNGIYISTNEGGNWQSVGLSQAAVTSLALGSSKYVLAGTDTGAFYSTDNGNNWYDASTGLTDKHIQSLTLNPQGFFFAGTRWGVFKSVDRLTPVQKTETNSAQENNLCQSFPNPFNSTTTIEFSISKLGFTTLKIYDLLGKEVATPISQNMTSGFHKIYWDASNVASGIYMYELRTQNSFLIKKTILVK